ncbi:MAG: hypothetical protein AB8H47_29630, partial [Bacteroidia bacterium]
MQRKLRKLIPGFLQKIDRDWMLNRPFLWATRIHYVLFFGLLGMGASTAFGLLQPISVSQIPFTTSFLILAAIPALMALGYWWYRLSHVFSDTSHELGIWRRNFVLILLGSLMIMAVPTSGWFIMEMRAMEVRSEIDRYEDSKALAKGLHLFESKLAAKQFYAYRNGQNPTYSWLYKYNEDQLAQEFDQSDPAMVAQAFLEVAHRYLPDSYPLTSQKLVEGYELKYFPSTLNPDAIWQWRQDIMRKINYWEDMGAFNPYALHSNLDTTQPSIDWKLLHIGTILLLIPFLSLGLSFIYLGVKPFIGLLLSLLALAGLTILMAPFMTYRIDIGESLYGVAAIISFFALYYGYGKPNAKPWQRSAQQIALMIG